MKKTRILFALLVVVCLALPLNVFAADSEGIGSVDRSLQSWQYDYAGTSTMVWYEGQVVAEMEFSASFRYDHNTVECVGYLPYAYGIGSAWTVDTYVNEFYEDPTYINVQAMFYVYRYGVPYEIRTIRISCFKDGYASATVY